MPYQPPREILPNRDGPHTRLLIYNAKEPGGRPRTGW